MIATVIEREQVDPLVRLAPEGPGRLPVSRSGARDVNRRQRMVDGGAPDTDRVLVEREDAGYREGRAELDPSIVSRREDFERDMMTAPGFMSDWALE